MTFWGSARRFLSRWGFALFVIAVVTLFHQVLLPFVLATLLAYVLAPSVDRLSRLKLQSRPLPRFAAVLVIYVGIVAAMALFFAIFLPRLSGDFARLFREAPAFFNHVRTDYAPRASHWLDDHLSGEVDADGELVGPRQERKISVVETSHGHYEVSLEGLELEIDPIGKGGRYSIGPRREIEPGHAFDDMVGQLVRASETQAMEVLKLGQRFITAVVKAVAGLVLTLMVAAFLLVDLDKVHAFLRSLCPARHRDDYDEVIAEMDRGLSGVIRGQFAICLINAILTYAGLLVLHVKYPLILGLIAGTMSLIPVFGSIVSSIPIVAIALIGGVEGIAFGKGLATLGWIIGIHLLEANLLNPKIVGHTARIHPVVVIFSLMVGETTGGLLGALIAVPVASVVQTLFIFFRRRAERSPADPKQAGPHAESSQVASPTTSATG